MTDKFTDGVPMNSSDSLKSIRTGNVQTTLILIGLVLSLGCQPEDVRRDSISVNRLDVEERCEQQNGVHGRRGTGEAV